MRSGSAGRLAPYLAVSLVMVAPEAWAYLDPSTGSMILSAIVGVFATAALALKTFWYKLKGLFRRDAARSDAAGGQPEQPKKPGEPPATRD